jgi:hypothetical protein
MKKELNSIENCMKNLLIKNKTQKLTTFVRAIKNRFAGHMRPVGRGLPTPDLDDLSL